MLPALPAEALIFRSWPLLVPERMYTHLPFQISPPGTSERIGLSTLVSIIWLVVPLVAVPVGRLPARSLASSWIATRRVVVSVIGTGYAPSAGAFCVCLAKPRAVPSGGCHLRLGTKTSQRLA